MSACIKMHLIHFPSGIKGVNLYYFLCCSVEDALTQSEDINAQRVLVPQGSTTPPVTRGEGETSCAAHNAPRHSPPCTETPEYPETTH